MLYYSDRSTWVDLTNIATASEIMSSCNIIFWHMLYVIQKYVKKKKKNEYCILLTKLRLYRKRALKKICLELGGPLQSGPPGLCPPLSNGSNADV